MRDDFKKINRFSQAFAEAYQDLPAASRAILRRADRPSALSAFWRCWNQAEESAGPIDKFRGRVVDLLADLIRVRLFESFAPHPEASFGSWLKAGKEVPERRIEALLSAQESGGVIEDLQAIAGFKRPPSQRAAPPLNLGDLVCGLIGNRLSPRTASRWAQDYFATSSREGASKS